MALMGRRTPRRTVLTGVNGFRFEIELDQIGDNRPRAHVGKAFVAVQKMKTSDRRLRDPLPSLGAANHIVIRVLTGVIRPVTFGGFS